MTIKQPRRQSYLTLVSIRIELRDGTVFSGVPNRVNQHEAAPLITLSLRQALNSAHAYKEYPYPLPFTGAGSEITAGLKRFEAYHIDSRSVPGHWYVIRFRAGDVSNRVTRVLGASEPGRVYRYVYSMDMAELVRELRSVIGPAEELES